MMTQEKVIEERFSTMETIHIQNAEIENAHSKVEQKGDDANIVKWIFVNLGADNAKIITRLMDENNMWSIFDAIYEISSAKVFTDNSV